MGNGQRSLTDVTGLKVYLPDGRFLGVVHDAVIEHSTMTCTHLFVRETPPELVVDSIHVAVPWRWVRSINDIVILRWFPETPISRA